MADPTPKTAAPVLPEMVRLTNKAGEAVFVTPEEKWDYLTRGGYSDPSDAGPNGDGGGLQDSVLSRAEALARGTTLGVSGPIADAAASLAGMAAGDNGPRATAPGIDAPVDQGSNFLRGMETAQTERQQRSADLGTEGYAWELAGGLVPALATGGTGALARIAASSPAALANQVGQRAAVRLLGQQAGVAATAARGALAGAVEGVIGGASAAASENVPQAFENPGEVAGDILASAAIGGTLGGVLGGGFGVVEGAAARAAVKGDELAARIAAKQEIPALQALDATAAGPEITTRSQVLASQLPDEARSFAETALDRAKALQGGEEKIVAEGGRALRENTDRIKELGELLNERAGVAAKRELNKADVRAGILNDLTDQVDPDDALRLGEAQAARASHQSRLAELTSGLEEAKTAASAAEDARRAAQAALDIADVPPVKPSKAARTLMKEMGFDDLGDVERKAAATNLRERIAATAADDPTLPHLREIEGALGRPARHEIAPLRQALKDANAQVKTTAGALDGIQSEIGHAQTAYGAAEKELAGLGEPRRMTRMETETRAMLGELQDQVRQFEGTVAGKDADAAAQLRKQLSSHLSLVKDAFRRGDLELAYSTVDQGMKHALRDFANQSRSGVVAEFAKNLYDVPRTFLERQDILGPLADRNILANPSYSKKILADNDAHYRRFFSQSGEASAAGWGPGVKTNSETAQSLVGQIGEAGNESLEMGFKRAMAADVEDAANRAAAWGDEGAKKIADEIATLAKNNLDILDRATRVRRDAAAMRQQLQTGTSLTSMAAVFGAVTGNMAVGLPAIGVRWMLSTIGKQRGALLEKLAVGAAKLVRGTNTALKEGSKAVTRVALSDKARSESLNRASHLTDPTSPVFVRAAEAAERMNAASPGLGDEILRREISQAEYVMSLLPKPPSGAVFSPGAQPTRAAARQLDQVLAVTRNPGKAFDRALAGKAGTFELDAMRQFFPEPYDKMVNAIMSEIQANPERIKSSSMRMYLSRITNQPLTPALMNLVEAQRRAKAATAGAENAGKPQGQGANGSDGVTKRVPLSMDANEVYGTRADRIMAPPA